MSLSRLSDGCRGCPYQDTCSQKRLQAEGILQLSAQPIVENAAAPMLKPHSYRQIKIAPNTTVTIDLEDLKKELEERIYRSIGVPFIGLQNGA